LVGLVNKFIVSACNITTDIQTILLNNAITAIPRVCAAWTVDGVAFSNDSKISGGARRDLPLPTAVRMGVDASATPRFDTITSCNN
jgi:hypothetical protein